MRQEPLAAAAAAAAGGGGGKASLPAVGASPAEGGASSVSILAERLNASIVKANARVARNRLEKQLQQQPPANPTTSLSPTTGNQSGYEQLGVHGGGGGNGPASPSGGNTCNCAMAQLLTGRESDLAVSVLSACYFSPIRNEIFVYCVNSLFSLLCVPSY